MAPEIRSLRSRDEGIRKPITRRDFLKVAGVGAAAIGVGGGLTAGLAGCGGDDGGGGGEGDGREIKIGWVTPLTGPLAAFGEADKFCLDEWKAAAKGGIQTADGATHPINIIMKDSQSDSNRAATVAGDLITNDGVDIMMVASTPDTVNPVADQCEALGVPCVSNDCPWQPYFFGRGGDPENPFKWTYHMFWGLEDVTAVFVDMWNQLDTNKLIGEMWPNDADGNGWADPKTGQPPLLKEAGYEFVDGGRFQPGTQDFTAQITKFKSAGCELTSGVFIPPDFTNYWKQCAQQGFQPVMASVGKALLFPSALEAIGEIGYGLTTEQWWSPNHPFTSSLTGETCKELADKFTEKTGSQWTQPLLHYNVFEVVADALTRTTDVDDKESIITAVRETKIDTIAGPVDWTSGGPNNPVQNVSKTPLVGGMWVEGSDWPFEIIVVSNSLYPDIPLQGEVKPLEW
jgi:branched-chain amino acid transport system substrate-binding protein